MLYRALKDEDYRLHREDLENVVVEYKLGMMDPGRLTAAFERVARVYKNNKKQREVQKKTQGGREK